MTIFQERIKTEKLHELVYNLYDKKGYIARIRTFKQALNYELILRKVLKVIQYNQEEWRKSYININTKLGTEAKNDFEKDFVS